MHAPRIAMVAGEPSGDLLAAHLIGALAGELSGASFFGIGGPHMQAAGFDAWWPADKLAVRGYVEVLRHYREITGIRRALAARLRAAPPDLFIGVDAPDFNLDLETGLRAAGIRTAHFISPSIWAWRGGRIDQIRAACEEMLCVFPFEEKLYRAAGIGATYVGHPLADVIPQTPDRAGARARLGLAADTVIVALMPGSRQSELKYLADRFVLTAMRLARSNPDLRFVVPLANDATIEQWREALVRNHAGELAIQVAAHDTHSALAACDIALVASGTATLEAALFKRPMVIAYNMAGLSWQMMRRMKYQPYVGLPNILCGEFVVPEFLQEDALPENLAQSLANLLADGAARARITARFSALHGQLRQGMPERVARAIGKRFFPGGVSRRGGA